MAGEDFVSVAKAAKIPAGVIRSPAAQRVGEPCKWPGNLANSATALRRDRRAAFTLIELLICIAIIGVLIALLLPAVQAAREAVRRRQCGNNLMQLMLAMENYEASHETLPPGTVDGTRPLQSRPVGYQMSWIAQILPFIEEGNIYRHLDFSVGAYHPKNAAVRRLYLSLLHCPSDNSGVGSSGVGNYAGCHHDVEAPIDEDNHGVLFLNSRVRYRDIQDGRAQTIALGEIALKGGAELGWLSGSRSTLRNTGTPINETTAAGGLLASMASTGLVRQEQAVPLEDFPDRSPLPGSTAQMPWMYTEEIQFSETAEYQPTGVAGNPALVVGGFESQHMGRGAQFAFADGSVRFLVDTIDFSVYQRLGHRADGQLIDGR